VSIHIDELLGSDDFVDIVKGINESLKYLDQVRLLIPARKAASIWRQVETLDDLLSTEGKRLVVDISLQRIVEEFVQHDDLAVFDVAGEAIASGRSKGTLGLVICILTPSNCYVADDILMWLEEQEVREYSLGIGDGCLVRGAKCERSPGLSSFSEDQRFHLLGFFDKLASRAADDIEKRLFYRSLVDWVSADANQSVDDAWDTSSSVSLDAGCRLYRGPLQNTLLGSCLQRNAEELFFEAVNTFGHIQDLWNVYAAEMLGGLGPKRRIEQGKRIVVGPLQSKVSHLMKLLSPRSSLNTVNEAGNPKPQNWRNVLVTGWYGTETTGDKAILGELMHTLRAYSPDLKITLTTIDEKVSLQTNKELGLEDAQVIDIDEAHHRDVIDRMDAVLIGGGPLMEVGQIENVWEIFRQANACRKSRVIFGCGVGPIHTAQTRRYIADICRLTTTGFFRDQASYELATELGASPSLRVACDPSLAFLARWRRQMMTEARPENPLSFVSLLREQTKEYSPTVGLDERNAGFVRNIAQLFACLLKHYPEATVDLMPMHMYWKGNDDRLFNRRVLRALDGVSNVNLGRAYLNIDSLIERLYQSDIAIVMRYHAHLFSLALGIPFLSINYTGENGKVDNLLQRIGYKDFSEDYETFSFQGAVSKLKTLVREQEEISRYLLQKNEELVDGLQATYVAMWGECS